MGFTFKGIHSSTFTNFHYKTTSLPLLPRRLIDTQIVIGDKGKKIRFDNGYEDRYIALSCVFVQPDLQLRRKEANELTNWLIGEGELIFDFDPDRIYNARIEDEVILNMMGDADEFELEFVADPECFTNPIGYTIVRTAFDEFDSITTPRTSTISSTNFEDNTDYYVIVEVTTGAVALDNFNISLGSLNYDTSIQIEDVPASTECTFDVYRDILTIDGEPYAGSSTTASGSPLIFNNSNGNSDIYYWGVGNDTDLNVAVTFYFSKILY